jgi:multiple sugar transport system substrate-binding protein
MFSPSRMTRRTACSAAADPFHAVIELLLAILLGSLLSACGSATVQPSATVSGPTPTVTVPIDLPVTISLYGGFRDDELAVLDDQIARFEANNPDILVEIMEERGAGDPYDLMGQQLSEDGDATTDLVLMDDAWLAAFVANGWLVPIDGVADSTGVRLDAFFPGSVQAGTVQGQLYALPWIVDAGLLYYRQDLLDGAAGALPADWAGIQSLALKARDEKGVAQGYVWQGAAYESLTCNTLEYVWAYGGDVLDGADRVVFDSPETRAALEQMAGLLASGASPDEVAAYREGASLAAFRDGNAALMRNWPFAWERLHRDDSSVGGRVGITSLPASCLTGQYLALSAGSMHPRQALRLLRFLLDYEQQRQVALELGRPVALEAVYGDGGLIDARPFFETLPATLRIARPRPRMAAYLQVSEAIYTEVNGLLSGRQGVEETAANVQRRIEALQGQ